MQTGAQRTTINPQIPILNNHGRHKRTLHQVYMRHLAMLMMPLLDWQIRARKIRAHSRILRLESEVLRPENLVQSQLCA